MMRLVAILGFATACNQVLGVPEVRRATCNPAAGFERIAPVAGLDSLLGEQRAQLSGDELTIVFSRITIAGTPDAPVSRHGDLYMARRDHRDDDFHDAVALDPLNTELDELGAALSHDQQVVYFARGGPAQPYRIFAARRSGAGFGEIAPLVLGDDAASELEPYVTPGALFFASRRGDGAASLFSAAGDGTGFAAPRQLASLEALPGRTAYEDPVVSPDGLIIYFSAPPGPASPPDIWSASRSDPGQPFGAPHLVTELHSASADRPAWLSEDGCRLYFVTNRSGQGPGLWLASRQPP
jgi:hypothetical protein